MNFASDDRGVSPVVGAILVFGLVIAVIALIQANAIPLETQRMEYDQSQLQQEQWQLLGEDIEGSATDDVINSETLTLGSRVSVGFPFVPPGDRGSELRTADRTVVLQNVNAVGDSEVDDYWSGATKTFATAEVVHDNDWRQYRGPDLHSGPLGQYADFGDAVVPLDGSIVNGNTITLVAVEGRLSVSKVGATVVETYPVAAPMRTVSVDGGGNDLVIQVATDLSVAEVERLLADEPNVVAVNPYTGGGNEGVEIRLDGTQTYQLRLGKVSLERDADAPDAAYVTAETSAGSSIRPGETKEITFRVWSEYNTPVEGEDVTIAVPSSVGTFVGADPSSPSEITVTTDEDGAATAVLEPAITSGTVNVVGAIGSTPPTPSSVDLPTAAGIDVEVIPGGTGTGGGSGAEDGVSAINPGAGSDQVYVESTELVSSNPGSEKTLRVKFRNDSPSTAWTFSQARVSFWFSDDGTVPDYVEIPNVPTGNTPTEDEKFYLNEPFEDLSGAVFNAPITPGGTKTVEIGLTSTASQGDFFVLSLRFTSGSESQVVSYFIGVTK